jgi:hypothetical protein
MNEQNVRGEGAEHRADASGPAGDAASGAAGDGASGPAGIDAAVAALDYLDTAPTASHVAVFEHVHQTLTDALAAIDGV